MSKTRKHRLVRIGSAKRLTRGDGDQSFEINLQPKQVTG